MTYWDRVKINTKLGSWRSADQRRFPCYINSHGIVQYDILSNCHEYDFTIVPEFSEDGLKERVQKLERVLRVYF